MSQNKIYVGSLSYNATAEDIQSYFSQYGDIDEVKLVSDRDTGRSKGFAFVSFASQQAAQASLAADGIELMGRKIKVNMAREDDRRRSGGGGNGGRGPQRRSGGAGNGDSRQRW